MNADYDDWFEDNAPCSPKLSRKLHWPCSTGWTRAWHVVRSVLMLPLIVTVCVAAALAFASGCGSRAVFISETSPIRMGPKVTARVWMLVGHEWTLSQNEIEIPEGMYIVSPKFVEEAEK